MLLACLFPGFPQLLRAEPRLRDGLLFLVGGSALIGAIGLLFFWPVHDAPLENFFWLSVADMAEIYPLHLTPAVQAAGTVQPILPDGGHLLVRIPFFWQALGVYCGLYMICAALSLWDYGRSGHVRS